MASCNERMEGISNTITQPIAEKFGSLGRFVANRPGTVIGLALLVTVLCSLGFSEFTQESRADKLWVPQDSLALDHREFVRSAFTRAARIAALIAIPHSGGNALTPAGLQAAYNLHQRVLGVNARVTGKFASQFPDVYNISNSCVRNGRFCLQNTVLDYFKYNQTFISSFASTSAILTYLNQPANQVSVAGSPLPLNRVLGGLSVDSSGAVTSATALRFTYFTTNREVFDSSTGENVDPAGEAWEEALTNVVIKTSDPFFTVSGYTFWGLGEEFSKTIQGDLGLIGVGYVLIIFYTASQLGKPHPIYSRVAVSLMGVVSVGLSIVVSFSLSSAMGFFYGPVHGVLPFLLLGIGVDDMFIIVNAFQNTFAAYPPYTAAGKKMSIADRLAISLSHSGLSITITSLTDFFAFIVGSSTALPALSSFCVYAGIGILADFFFQVTFFAACLALDAKRMQAGRIDCCCCWKSSRPNKMSTNSTEEDVVVAVNRQEEDTARRSRYTVVVAKWNLIVI